MSLKNPVTPPGIDPGTFREVAQRLNHYATPGSHKTRGADVQDDDNHLEGRLDDTIINHVQYINISISTKIILNCSISQGKALHGAPYTHSSLKGKRQSNQ